MPDICLFCRGHGGQGLGITQGPKSLPETSASFERREAADARRLRRPGVH